MGDDGCELIQTDDQNSEDTSGEESEAGSSDGIDMSLLIAIGVGVLGLLVVVVVAFKMLRGGNKTPPQQPKKGLL